MNSSIEAALNPQQWEATRYIDGHQLIIAGAGSGKTRVLTYKIAYLISQGISPSSILALTFTNKAAREMNGRIADVVGENVARGLWSGTFHSIFSRILRTEAEFIGYSSNYSIYDASDSKNLIKAIVKELGLDEKTYKAATIASYISEAKNAVVLPDDYCASYETKQRDARNGLPRLGDIYTIYNDRLHTASAMDFDDLLLNTVLLFRKHPSVCDKYATRFRYILVDEYQDTNAAQHRIIMALSRPETRICAVGDDAQSIYGFRGACIDNILNFTTHFEGGKLFKLERNYRSTQNIVNAADSIIRHNRGQIEKRVYSTADIGEPIRLFAASSDKEEAAAITGEIRRLHRRNNLEFSDIALLYRTNAQSRSFEEALRMADIPYRIYGGLSFYQRKEIKDIMAYLRLVTNDSDEEAFKRIINYPTRGIGATTVGKLHSAATEHRTSMMQVAESPTTFGVTLGAAATKKLKAFVELMGRIREKSETLGCYALTLYVLHESGIMADISTGSTAEDLSRKENVEELINSIKAFESDMQEERGDGGIIPLSEYLSNVSLLTDTDREEDDAPRVSLMTIHAAKGLEFSAVFVTGLENNLFPCSSAFIYPKEMEEERRLFYVAVTRAKQFCYLTYAASRFRYGKIEYSMPSSFLNEVDQQYIRKGLKRNPETPTSHGQDPLNRPTLSILRPLPSSTGSAATTKRHSSSSAAETGLQVGTRIRHERFGCGLVTGIEGSGSMAAAIVDFENLGTKKLLLRFARYDILS